MEIVTNNGENNENGGNSEIINSHLVVSDLSPELEITDIGDSGKIYLLRILQASQEEWLGGSYCDQNLSPYYTDIVNYNDAQETVFGRRSFLLLGTCVALLFAAVVFIFAASTGACKKSKETGSSNIEDSKLDTCYIVSVALASAAIILGIFTAILPSLHIKKRTASKNILLAKEDKMISALTILTRADNGSSMCFAESKADSTEEIGCDELIASQKHSYSYDTQMLTEWLDVNNIEKSENEEQALVIEGYNGRSQISMGRLKTSSVKEYKGGELGYVVEGHGNGNSAQMTTVKKPVAIKFEHVCQVHI